MASRKKKKKIKVDPDGIAYIKATFNNTLVTLADKFGNVITWSSAGALGFKGSRKNTPFAADLVLRPLHISPRVGDAYVHCLAPDWRAPWTDAIVEAAHNPYRDQTRHRRITTLSDRLMKLTFLRFKHLILYDGDDEEEPE